ncbi:MAG: hypothetical protein HXY41_06250 [Chloroflexi bacterium]|nr:hypothetical protein [Chloroflexota bacterium]
MQTTGAPRYPDILGTLTGGERFDAGLVQLALAVRPRVTRAGRVFEVILLMQNCADTGLEIRGKLLLPETDALDKPERFVAQSEPLSVILRPAEAGYTTLPVQVLPDAAPGGAYKVAVAVEFQPVGEPAAVRQIASAPYHYLPPETSARLLELKSLAFSTARRGLFGSVIEAPFGVLPPQIIPAPQPDYISLWSPGDSTDARPLLERHGQTLRQLILPQISREALLPPLLEKTSAVFASAGYTLHAAEAHFIAGLLAAVLDMAHTPRADYPGQEIYSVGRLLEQGWPLDGSPIPLPDWCRALLVRLDENLESARSLPALLAGPLYSDVLRDAIAHGFNLLHLVAPQELGSEDDKRAYGEQLVEILEQPALTLSFVDVYLPLALGGIIAEGRAGRLTSATLDPIVAIVEAHPSGRAVHEPVHELIEQVMDWARSKTGG